MSSRLTLSLLAVLFVILFVIAAPVYAQDLETGFQSYGGYHINDFDAVSIGSGALTLHIPLYSYPQRGKLPPLSMFVRYQSFTWTLKGVATSGGTYYTWYPATYGALLVTYAVPRSKKFSDKTVTPTQYAYNVTDADGASHIVGSVSGGTTQETVDGSGFRLSSGNIIDKNGIEFCFTTCFMQDNEGNAVTLSSTDTSTIIDSVGRKIPVIITAVNPTSPGCTTYNLPDFNGATAPYTFCWSSYTATSNFPTSTYVSNSSSTVNLMSSITLPNGAAWRFNYNSWGDLSSITMPTGGTISYTWTAGASGGIYPATTPRLVNSRSVDDGTGPKTFNYSGGVLSDPLGNDTVYTFTSASTHGPNVLTQVQYFNGTHASGTLQKTINTQYAVSGPNPYGGLDGNNGPYSIIPIVTKTTLPNGEVSQTCLLYDSMTGGPCGGTYNPSGSTFYDANNGTGTTYPFVYGSVVQKSEYDYGSGNPGPLLRQTNTQFQWQANGSYLTASLLSRPSSVTVLDGGGHQLAQTSFGYDENNGSPQGIFGNQTSVTRWLNGGTSPKTQTVYNTQAMPIKTIDAKNNATTITYDSTGMFPSQIQYPTTANGVAHIEKFAYDTNIAKMTSHTDQNSQTTSSGYDSMGRLTSVTYPTGGGSETYAYNDSIPASFTFTKAINGTTNLVQVGNIDGLGRPTQTSTTSNPASANPEGAIYTATAYDVLGHVTRSYNPTRCSPPTTNCGEATWGYTSNVFDVLGRATQVTQPDGNTVLTSYTGRATQVQDEGNGSQRVTRISQVDGLGRLTSVCEVAPGPFVGSGGASSSSLIGSGGTPGACGLDIGGTGFLTSYQYDALDNLLQVNQSGVGPRKYNYDSLSRLTSEANPESGPICYGTVSGGVCQGNGYDANGNSVTKTDARGIVATFAYDALNRSLSKSFSDTTPGTTNTYDIAVDGLAITYPVGRLVKTATNDCKTATVNSFDQMGRINNQWQCTPQNCGTGYFSLPYAYDLAGDITSAGNGKGVTISYGYNGVAALTNVSSTLSDANHPATLLSNATYSPFGGIASAKLGNGFNETRAYDTRLRLHSYSAGPPTGGLATPGTGNVTISGTEKSTQVGATPGTGTITVSGSEQSVNRPAGCSPVWDGGYLAVTVNGVQVANVAYGNGISCTAPSPMPTATSLAAQLAATINSSSLVGATANGTVITLTSKTSGANTNYSLSTHVTSAFVSGGLGPASFSMTTSGANLTGGSDTTLYDKGTVSITVNGSAASSYTYGQTDTSSTIASGLVSNLSSTFVNGSASGSVVTLTAKTTGASTNYPVSTSITYDTTHFSSASFTAAPSGSTLTGGTDNTIYSLAMSSYAPNGDVLSANDSVNGNWTYNYDQFNRVVGANQNNGQFLYNYVFDVAGNRWQQNGFYHPPNLNFTGSNNRIDGYSYDLSGNLLNDGTNAYTFDAENRIITAGTSSYVYDANGRRVRKTVAGTSVDFLYDLNGTQITEISSTGVWNRGEVYAGSRHLATYSNSTTYFNHADWVGTERVRSSVSGGFYETCSSLPFGDFLTCSASDPSPMHFTGQEHDTDSGLDYFGARHNSSTLARFMSPDPDNAGSTNEDPQSWNGYAYVRNNPLLYADPDGLAFVVCIRNASEDGGMSCTTYENDDQFYRDVAASGATLSGGNIYLNNVLVGTYKHYNSMGTSEDNILAPILFGGIAAGVKAGVRGIAGAVARSGVKTVVTETVTASAGNTAENIVAAGSKAAVREVIEDAAINDAQKAAVKQVLKHARPAQDIVVEKLSDGTLQVTRVAVHSGGGEGRAEYVTRIAVDGARRTIQYGYDAAGNLVHSHTM